MDDFTPLGGEAKQPEPKPTDDFTPLPPVSAKEEAKGMLQKIRDFSIPVPGPPKNIGDVAASAFGPIGDIVRGVSTGNMTQLPVGTGQVRPILTGIGSGIGAAGGPVGSFAGGFTGSQAGRLLQEISPDFFGEADSPLTGGLKDAAINELIGAAFKGVKFAPEKLKLIKQQLLSKMEPAAVPEAEATAGNFIPGKISESPEQIQLRSAGKKLRTSIAGGELPDVIEEQGKSAFGKVHETVKDLEEGFNAQHYKTTGQFPSEAGVEYDPADELPPDIRKGYKKALPTDQGGEGTPSKFFESAIKTPEGTRRLVEYVGREETANHYLTKFLGDHNQINSEGEKFFDAIRARKTFDSDLPIIKEFTNADQRSQIKYFLDHTAAIDPRLTKTMTVNLTGDTPAVQITPDIAQSLFGKLVNTGVRVASYGMGPAGKAVRLGLRIAPQDWASKVMLNPSAARAAASLVKTPYQNAAGLDATRIILGALQGATVGLVRNDEPVGDFTVGK